MMTEKIKLFLETSVSPEQLDPTSPTFEEDARIISTIYEEGIQRGLAIAGEMWRIITALMVEFADHQLYRYLETPYHDLRSWAHSRLLAYVPGKDEAAKRDTIGRMCHTVEKMLLPIAAEQGMSKALEIIETTPIEALKEQAGRFARLNEENRRRAVEILSSGATGAQIRQEIVRLEEAQSGIAREKPILYLSLNDNGKWTLFAEELSEADALFFSRLNGYQVVITERRKS